MHYLPPMKRKVTRGNACRLSVVLPTSEKPSLASDLTNKPSRVSLKVSPKKRQTIIL
jgi:hypothetical protein